MGSPNICQNCFRTPWVPIAWPLIKRNNLLAICYATLLPVSAHNPDIGESGTYAPISRAWHMWEYLAHLPHSERPPS